MKPATPSGDRVRVDDIGVNASNSIDGSGRPTLSADGPAADEEEIRRGSPFAEPDRQAVTVPALRGEVMPSPNQPIDVGVAMAAPLASIIVMLFAAACCVWFPGGGLVVAPLGSLLALIGLFTKRRVVSAVLLTSHIAVFFACYRDVFEWLS
ncbi:MAG: hypothetical protein AAF670_01625 [Planctomycetota bacterium]